MRKYETIFICDPDLQEKERVQFFDRVKQIVAKGNGFITNFDDWGSKKLAYEIRKKPRGHYVCMTYGGSGDLVNELERNFRLTDEVMKFMTIVLEKDVTMEKLETEAKENTNKAENTSQDQTDEAVVDSDVQEQDHAEEQNTLEENAQPAE